MVPNTEAAYLGAPMTAALDRELLARIGTVLYGEHWQAPMARALGKSMHTVSRWATGSTKPPSLPIWQRLLTLLNAKLIIGGDLWEELAAALDPRNRRTESDRQFSRKEKPHEPDQYLEPAAPNQDTGAR